MEDWGPQKVVLPMLVPLVPQASLPPFRQAFLLLLLLFSKRERNAIISATTIIMLSVLSQSFTYVFIYNVSTPLSVTIFMHNTHQLRTGGFLRCIKVMPDHRCKGMQQSLST